MSTEAQDSIPENSSSLGIGGDEAGDFECNICFDLATDPIITLCGHLYCWPCLCKWLRLHSRSSRGCPVCKAIIQEEKLIPLYGRGKIQTDPRSKPVPGIEIPNRTEPAQFPEGTNLSNSVSGSMPTVGNFGMSAGFGGANFSFQVHGFSNAGGYGSSGGYSRPFRGAEGNLGGQQADGILKRVHFVVFILVLFALFLL